MDIAEEIKRIKARGVIFNNIAQLSAEQQNNITDLKRKWFINFGYAPGLKECAHILINNLSEPHKCKNEKCYNLAKFRIKTDTYSYCSRICSDSDPVRNKSNGEKVKQLRVINGSYKTGAIKGVNTKYNTIDPNTGANIHDTTGIKVSRFIADNPSLVKERISKSKITYTTEKRKAAAELATDTKMDRYGVCHFGGGLSKLRDVFIGGAEFKIQGYEDVAIYELVYNGGYSTNDIVSIARNPYYAIKYIDLDGEERRYYPDIFIKSENRYIEVKSLYWYKKEKENTDTKIRQSSELGYNITLKIYEDIKYVARIRRLIREIGKKEN